jgi:hypothetical protein
MAWDTFIGIILLIVALIAIIFLTLWSRRIIERIHTRSLGSLREIERDKENG